MNTHFPFAAVPSDDIPGMCRNEAILISSDPKTLPQLVDLLRTLAPQPPIVRPVAKWPEDAPAYVHCQPAPEVPQKWIPHPEQHMNYVAEIGSKCWGYTVFDHLDGMRNRRFPKSFMICYPTVSRDGMNFPVNEFIKELQGSAFQEETAWRGNIVVAKFKGDPFTSMTNATMADYAILKFYLATQQSPQRFNSMIVSQGNLY